MKSIFHFLRKMYNNLKCPKLDFCLSGLPKLAKGDDYFHFITAPLLLERLGGKFFVARVLGVYKEVISQVGHGWDN